MITLSKSGGTVTFTFDDNSTYLQNGTIEVPLNSLSLIIDESGMATFRKSASNDIFISALYSEFGMSKAELEAWYKENMVGSAGIDSGAVQTQIDESISGKADTSALTVYFDDVEYDSSAKTINFYNDGVLKDSIDASDFVIDGMIDDVRIETISGASYLVIDFNTASGKEDIQIPLSDIFNPDNYYDKTAIDGIVSGLNEDIATKLDASAYTPTDLSQYWTSAQTESAITEAVSGKQDTLIAGEHITISGNVISAEASTVPYDGYSYIEIFTGSTMGLDKIETPFYVVSGSSFCFEYKGNGEQPWGDYTCALLDWTNHTSSFQEQGAEEYVSVTWDAKYNAFKFDTLQEGHDITYVSGRNWGYGVDIVPSGTTNETFDNVIEYVIDSDNALNSNLSSKFNNYLTTSAASNTYLAKENSAAIKYTQGMFESGQTNINGGIVAIQNGFEYYVINTPLGNNRYPSSYGKGILRESFVLGMADALYWVLWKDDEAIQTWVFGIPQAEVFNGGLVGRKVFVIWNGGYTSAIYFKCENATITSGETQIDFSLSGKIYFDDECTKEYKSYPNWNVQGSVTKDGEVNGYFSAMQLEMDGFFGNKTQKQGVFYDENGGEHKIPHSFNTYSTNGGIHNQGNTIFAYCLVNQNISGNYYLYTLNGSLVSNQSKRFSTSDVYMNVNVPLVDYSKLSPLGFEYVVNDDSTDNQGTVGVKYRKYDEPQSRTSYYVSIGGQSYTLVDYSEGDWVYNDESVSGVYTITVDEEGYRTLMVSDIEGHHFIQGTDNVGIVEIPTTYYVHYTNGTSQEGITSGEVQSMIDESISGLAESSAVTLEISEAVSGKADADSLATVATSGSYDDLINKPTIPTVPTSNTAFTNDAGYATSGYVDSAVSGKADTATTYTKTEVDTALASKQTTLTAGTGISIVDNVISATGGGGLDSDTERLLSTAINDLNDRKIDASEVKSNYQKKGDYATKSELAAKANASEVMTLEKAKENELVTATALNDLNNKFGGLSLVKMTESEYAALATKDENTLYVVVADPS